MLGSSKVDVALEAGFTGAFQQPKQRSPLRGTSPAPDDDDETVMRLALGQLNEVVPVAGHQEATVFMGELENDQIGGLRREHVA